MPDKGAKQATAYIREQEKTIEVQLDGESKAWLVRDDLEQAAELASGEGCGAVGLSDVIEEAERHIAEAEAFAAERTPRKRIPEELAGNWHLKGLGTSIKNEKPCEKADEVAVALLSLGKSLDISIEKAAGKSPEFCISTSQEASGGLKETLCGFYGRVDLYEKADIKSVSSYDYKSMAVFSRDKKKDESARSSLAEAALDWPALLGKSCIQDGYCVRIRLRPVREADAVERLERALNWHRRYAGLAAVSTQASANGSVNAGIREDIFKGMFSAAKGANTRPSFNHGISASTSVSKKQLRIELLLESLKGCVERMQEALQSGAWAVTADIGASSQQALQTAEALLSASFMRTPFSLRWTQDAKESCEQWILLKEAGFFIQLPQENFPGFERMKNQELSVFSPPAEEDGVCLGDLIWQSSQIKEGFWVSRQAFNRHAFVCGMTGAGKSNTMFHLLRELDLPFLVIEPVKGEYGQLAATYPDLEVKSMSVQDENVLQINPFWFPPGSSLQYHIDSLHTIISSAFVLYSAMPNILEQCINRVYYSCGWNIASGQNENAGEIGEEYLYPTLDDLCDEIERYLQESDYEGETLSTYKGALLTRLRTLASGTKGLLFNASSHPDYEQWSRQRVTVDLEELSNDADKSIFMGVIMTQYYEYIRMKRKNDKSEKLCHLIVIEEAHRLFKNVRGLSNPESASCVEHLVELLSNMMAEIRAYGEGIFVVDQSPAKIAGDVIKNSNIKVIHRMDDKDDIDIIRWPLHINDELSDTVSLLQQGEAFVRFGRMDKPAMIQVQKEKGFEGEEPAQEESPNIRLIEQSAARFLLQDRKFLAVLESLLLKFAQTMLYDSLSVQGNEALEQLLRQIKRRVIVYGGALERHADSPEFMMELVCAPFSHVLHSLFQDWRFTAECRMLVTRSLQIYLENGEISQAQAAILEDYREYRILNRLGVILSNSDDRIYAALIRRIRKDSCYYGLIWNVQKRILQEDAHFFQGEADEKKKNLLAVCVRSQFLIPPVSCVQEEVLSQMIRLFQK